MHRCSPQELPGSHGVFARLRWKRLHRLLPGVCYTRGWQCGVPFFCCQDGNFFGDHQNDTLHFWLSFFFEMMRICQWYWEGATPKLHCSLWSLEFLRIQGWDDLESQMHHHEPEPILFSLVFFCEV